MVKEGWKHKGIYVSHCREAASWWEGWLGAATQRENHCRALGCWRHRLHAAPGKDVLRMVPLQNSRAAAWDVGHRALQTHSK